MNAPPKRVDTDEGYGLGSVGAGRAGVSGFSGRLQGRRLGGELHLAAAEGLKAELGDLLLADAVVLLDGGPRQGGQPVALGGKLAELLGSLLLAGLHGLLLLVDSQRLRQDRSQLDPERLKLRELVLVGFQLGQQTLPVAPHWHFFSTHGSHKAGEHFLVFS